MSYLILLKRRGLRWASCLWSSPVFQLYIQNTHARRPNFLPLSCPPCLQPHNPHDVWTGASWTCCIPTLPGAAVTVLFISPSVHHLTQSCDNDATVRWLNSCCLTSNLVGVIFCVMAASSLSSSRTWRLSRELLVSSGRHTLSSLCLNGPGQRATMPPPTCEQLRAKSWGVAAFMVRALSLTLSPDRESKANDLWSSLLLRENDWKGGLVTQSQMTGCVWGVCVCASNTKRCLLWQSRVPVFKWISREKTNKRRSELLLFLISLKSTTKDFNDQC